MASRILDNGVTVAAIQEYTTEDLLFWRTEKKNGREVKSTGGQNYDILREEKLFLVSILNPCVSCFVSLFLLLS